MNKIFYYIQPCILKGFKEFNLYNGITIRIAKDKEKEIIKNAIGEGNDNYYNIEYIDTPQEKIKKGVVGSGKYVVLDITNSPEFHYNKNVDIDEILKKGHIQEDTLIKLKTILKIFNINLGSQINIYPDSHSYSINPINARFVSTKGIRTITLSQITQISEKLEKLMDFNNTYFEIPITLNLFLKASNNLESDCKIKIILFYSSIESLICHKSDSNPIMKQITNKIILLNNRFETKLETNDFGDTKLDKIIKETYNLRSVIAHGGEYDFSKKFLKNEKLVCNFLEQITRKLIIHYLKEPILIKDLKNC